MKHRRHEIPRYSKKIKIGDLTLHISNNVYEPAEDTFLIAKNLKAEGLVLDMGTGCGILSILAACKAKHVIAVDINPYAAKCAKLNVEINEVSSKVDIIVGDLFTPLIERPIFDMILFNAPYLPTEDSEPKGPIEYAWSGGRGGREVIDSFIRQAPKYLKVGGKILIVQSSLSNVEKTIREFSKQGFQVRIIDRQNLFFETIILIEAFKDMLSEDISVSNRKEKFA